MATIAKSEVLKRLREGALLPVIRVPTAEDALAMCQTLVAAGITNLEVPLTVPGGVEVIRQLCAQLGDRVLVGAGTVLDEAAAEACVAAGARFIISPGLDLATVAYCKRVGVAAIPGALTPTEVITAWKAGADIVKIFPASAVGGAAYLRALKAPLPQVEMVPTGGVSVDTAADFIKAGAAALGVGGDLVDLKALREGRGAAIGEKAQRYLEVVRTARAAG